MDFNPYLNYKIIYFINDFYSNCLLLLGVKASLVRERQIETNGDRGKQRQTVILTHNFFLATPRCVIFKSFFSPTRRIQPVLTRGLLGPLQPLFSICRLYWPVKDSAARLWNAQPLACALRDWVNLFWLQAKTDCRLTVSHLGICIYHFSTPIISAHPPDSFHLFTLVRSEKSLIDSLVKGQYATLIY